MLRRALKNSAARHCAEGFHRRRRGIDNPTRHDVPVVGSTGRIGGCAARCYHLVAVTPLDLGAMLTADRL